MKKSLAKKRTYYSFSNWTLEDGKTTAEWEETTEKEITEMSSEELLRRYVILNVHRDKRQFIGLLSNEEIVQFPELDQDIKLMQDELHNRLSVIKVTT